MFRDSELPDRRSDSASEPTGPASTPLPHAGTRYRWRIQDLLTPPLAVPLGLAVAILAYGFWVRL